jgi:putative FmdB family regulatory protein
MPTYDYQCDACGHTLEIFQGINDPVKKKCPECGKNRLKRQFGTGAAIVFKGSGFYQTDYRSEGYKKAAEADKKAGSSGGDGKSKSDGKSKGDAGKSDAGSASGSPSGGSSSGGSSSGGSSSGGSSSGGSKSDKPSSGDK